MPGDTLDFQSLLDSLPDHSPYKRLAILRGQIPPPQPTTPGPNAGLVPLGAAGIGAVPPAEIDIFKDPKAAGAVLPAALGPPPFRIAPMEQQKNVSMSRRVEPYPGMDIASMEQQNKTSPNEAEESKPRSKGVEPNTGIDIFKDPKEWFVQDEKPKVEGVFAKNNAAPKEERSRSFDPTMLSSSTVVPEHEGRSVSAKTEGMLGEATELQGKAATALGAARVNEAQAAEQAAKERADLYKRFAEQTKSKEEKRDALLSAHLENQQRLANDIANSKIDIDDYWGHGVGGGLRRVGSLIAQTLGAIAGGLRGDGRNQAAELLERDIDRWIGTKAKEVENKKSALAGEQNLFQQKREMFGDNRAAEIATKADLLNAAAASAEQLKYVAQTDVQRAEADKLIADWKEKAAKLNNELHPLIKAQAVADPRQARFQKLADEMVGKGMSSNDALELAMHQVYGVGRGDLKLQQNGGGGGGARMQALVAQRASQQDMIDAIDREIAAIKKGFNLSLTEGGKSSTRRTMLAGGLAMAIDGSSSDAKIEQWKNELPPDVGYTGAWNQAARIAKYQELRKIVAGKMKATDAALSHFEGNDAGTPSTDTGDTGETVFATGKPIGTE